MKRGGLATSMQVNIKKVPAVSITQLMVQKAQPNSISGVEWTMPGTACI